MNRIIVAAIVTALGLAFSAVEFTAKDEHASASVRSSSKSTGFESFPGAIPAESINPAMLDHDVVLVGKVQRFTPSTSERTPTRVVLSQRESASVMVVYWPEIAPHVENGDGPIAIGTMVSARGKLTDYRGDLQIRVTDPAQVLIEGRRQGTAPDVPRAVPSEDKVVPASGSRAQPGTDGYHVIGDLPNLGWHERAEIAFKGIIHRFQLPTSERAPHIIHVSDGRNDLQIVYWAEPGRPVPVFDKVGQIVYASGQLGTYRNSRQLRVEKLDNLSYQALPATAIAQVETATRATAASHPAPKWHNSYKEAFEQARREAKPVIVYFRSSETPRCVEFESNVLLTNEFNRLANDYVCVFEDVTVSRNLTPSFKVIRVPHIAVVDPSGQNKVEWSFNIPPAELMQAIETTARK